MRPGFADIAEYEAEAEFSSKFREAIAQLRTSRADILEELFFLDDLEKFQGHGESQRAAAESGAVHPGRDARGDLLCGKDGAERKTGVERLGNQNNVRS